MGCRFEEYFFVPVGFCRKSAGTVEETCILTAATSVCAAEGAVIQSMMLYTVVKIAAACWMLNMIWKRSSSSAH
jgi:hypothetical protein